MLARHWNRGWVRIPAGRPTARAASCVACWAAATSSACRGREDPCDGQLDHRQHLRALCDRNTPVGCEHRVGGSGHGKRVPAEHNQVMGVVRDRGRDGTGPFVSPPTCERELRVRWDTPVTMHDRLDDVTGWHYDLAEINLDLDLGPLGVDDPVYHADPWHAAGLRERSEAMRTTKSSGAREAMCTVWRGGTENPSSHVTLILPS